MSRFHAWSMMVCLGVFSLGSVGCQRFGLLESQPDPMDGSGDSDQDASDDEDVGTAKDALIWYDDEFGYGACFSLTKEGTVEVPCDDAKLDDMACSGTNCCPVVTYLQAGGVCPLDG